jgi:Sulfotransferase domain
MSVSGKPPLRGAVESAAPAVAQASAGRVPDFFIVGHEKCGTTALYRILKSHREIFMPEFKEPRFFSEDRGSFDVTPAPSVRRMTLEDYLALFAPARADQQAGEASPQYIRSPLAARAIAELQPHARIIAILREPVSFVRSYHLQCLRSNLETQRDLRKAIALEPARREGRKIPRSCPTPMRLFYTDHVRYVEQLQRFADVFAPEQILVLTFEDFRRDNEGTAREVLRFLDVDPDGELEGLDTQAQVRKAVRSTHLNNITRAVKRARRKPDSSGVLARATNALVPSALDPVWRRLVYAPPAPLDETFASELRDRFKPEVLALSEYLGRDLAALWGYDRTT